MGEFSQLESGMVGRRVAVWGALSLCLVSGCGDDHHTASRTPRSAVTATATLTTPLTPTGAATPTSTPGQTRTATSTATPTPTLCECTATATASQTPTQPQDPEITFFGITRSDDLPLMPSGVDDQGRPVFMRVQGQGMSVVLEARNGRRRIIDAAYDPAGGPRGVEFLVSRPLGNGSPVVCDVAPPGIGGVPGIDPPVFTDDADVQHAIDDFGCRVNDGSGGPYARPPTEACTRMEPSFEYAFVDADSDVQFCVPIALAWNFPVGDTVVAARVRDVGGAVSETREIVVRVEQQQPFECDQGLGERELTVTRPASRLLSSATAADDASTDPWSAPTLRICAGAEIADGIHPLNLREDVTVGVTLEGGGTLCARIFGRGSSGSIDCDGGTAGDVLALRDADGLTRVAVHDGLGLDAGTGAAVIRAPVAILQLPEGSSPADCAAAVYPPPFNAVLTTATGTAQVTTATGEPIAEATGGGVNFDCTSWQHGGPGAFALPFPFVNSPAGDIADVLVLAE